MPGQPPYRAPRRRREGDPESLSSPPHARHSPREAARLPGAGDERRLVFFRESMFKTDCERCGVRFDPVKGGVCEQCKRILCGDHLYGSLGQRLRVQLLGATPVCIYCRAEVPGAASSGSAR